MDVVEALPRPRHVLLLDDAVYPLTRWAAGAVPLRPAEESTYQRRTTGRAASASSVTAPGLLVTDGVCAPAYGRRRSAPARPRSVRRRRRLSIVDDTLAAFVLGAGGGAAWVLRPGVGAPPRDSGSRGGPPPNGVASSLAKGTAAALDPHRPARDVARVRREGPTRVHAGPPTTADVAALRSALDDGSLDVRRSRLARHVVRVRRRLGGRGLCPLGIPFPLLATGAGGATPSRSGAPSRERGSGPSRPPGAAPIAPPSASACAPTTRSGRSPGSSRLSGGRVGEGSMSAPLVIDAHVHIGTGDGMTGPWDTERVARVPGRARPRHPGR